MTHILDMDVWHVFIAPPSDKVMIKICVFMSFLHEHARIFVIFAEKLIVKDSWYFVSLTLSSNSDRTKNHENHIFILKLTTLAIIRNWDRTVIQQQLKNLLKSNASKKDTKSHFGINQWMAMMIGRNLWSNNSAILYLFKTLTPLFRNRIRTNEHTLVPVELKG